MGLIPIVLDQMGGCCNRDGVAGRREGTGPLACSRFGPLLIALLFQMATIVPSPIPPPVTPPGVKRQLPTFVMGSPVPSPAPTPSPVSK